MTTTNRRQFTDETVLTFIQVIRSQKVILDKDLAALYDVSPRRLREQVKRNPARFPANFMFQLTEKELESVVSHFATPSKKQFGGFLPYAFTEHGVLMAASVLKSERAVEVSLRVIEIFVRLREMLVAHKDVAVKLEQLEKKLEGQDKDIRMIFTALKNLLEQPVKPRERIGYKLSSGKK